MKKIALLLVLVSLVFGSCEMVEDVLGTNDDDQGTTDTGTTGTGSPTSIPLIPGTPSISPGGAGELVLQWTDNSDNESGFKVERSAVSASSGFALAHTLGANTSSLIDTGLAEETRYWYRICSYNSAGNSGYTAVVSGVTIKGTVVIPRPAAPSGLFGAYSDIPQLGIYKVMLEWTDNSTNETSFIIERSSTSASTGFTQIGTKSQNLITYTDSTVSKDRQYWYRVCASNSAGNSAYSNVLAIYTADTDPVTESFYPSCDNLVAYSSMDDSVANDVYKLDNLRVGCDWQYNIPPGMSSGYQHGVVSASLLKFDVSSLAGKTIDEATLTLTTSLYGVGYYPRSGVLRAMMSNWNGNTMTWNIYQTTNYYLGFEQTINPPSYQGQKYEFDVKVVVQNWADGTWLENGFIIAPTDLSLPNATSLDTFAFYSMESTIQSRRPVLEVRYH